MLNLRILNRKNCVITHGNCRDGFVASLCAKLHYGSRDDIIYWEVDPSYQLENLNKLFEECLLKYPEVNDYIFTSFDVSFVPNTIRTFLENNSSKGITMQFSVYDHHKTAIDAWASEINEKNVTAIQVEIPEKRIAFYGNIRECGASLAWNYYFPGIQCPKFIDYVKDRDNWLFDTPEAIARNSIDVNEYLVATAPPPEDLEQWFTYLTMDTEEETVFYNNASKMGKLLTDMKAKQLLALANSGGVRKINGQRVFVCNCTILQSDVGNLVVNLKPDGKPQVYVDPVIGPINQGEYLCDWALLWRFDEKDQIYHVSLRSRKGGTDVSAIAQLFGGGGHAAAAGFKIADIDAVFIKLRLPNEHGWSE